MPPYNPLAYQRPKALRKQARRDVRATSLPLVRQINREAAAGSRNITGIASQLASQMGGYQQRLGDIYGRARSSLEGYQQQGQQQLGAAGSAIGADLAKALALSGNQGGGFQADLARVTGGFQERGSAELGALAQRQAAAEEFGAKLPELTRLSGMQATQERAARAQQDISRVNASIPEQVQRLIESGRARNMQIGLANLAYQGDIFGEQQQTERTRLQQRGQNQRAARTASINERKAAETARHNRNMEAADRASENRQEKIRRETARHNRAMEKISKGKGLSKKKGGGKTSLLP